MNSTHPDRPAGADELRRRLGEHVLVDGHHIVLDTTASQSPLIRDAYTGIDYLDFSTFYASSPLGMNHPSLTGDPEFVDALTRVAVNKPANPDFYSLELLRFVETFARVLGDPALPHLFFVEGGALAVENALKVAFDWKSRLNETRGLPEVPLQVLHLEHAFHGRSGYTMSLTNTDPVKVARYPKFAWPRIAAPACSFPPDPYQDRLDDQALAQARAHLAANPDAIACIIAEPIQGEGGDRHLSARFLRGLQDLAHEHDALFILDEVQTGVGLTGSAWCYQQLGLEPDVVAFAKKVQLGGIMAGRRVCEVADNVFSVPSRISSTWGGALTDMVRATRILEIIEDQGLIANAARRGEELLAGLQAIASRRPALTQPRGRGLMCAFDLPSGTARDACAAILESDHQVLVLKCGPASLRLRPPLTVTSADIERALDAVDAAVATIPA